MCYFEQKNKTAFTIIELLVVMSLIASLAGLLFPVFAQARGKAREAACLSNLRQIGLADQMYCQDYDGIYAYALDPSDKYLPDGWSGEPVFQAAIPYLPMLNVALQPYAKSNEIFHCPSDSGLNSLDLTTLPLIASPSAYQEFGMSYASLTELTVEHLSEEQLIQPSYTARCYDLTGRWHGGPNPNDWRFMVVLTDGHCKSCNLGQFVDILDHLR